MEFNSSPKTYKNYKSKNPRETIRGAKNFLKKIRLKVSCRVSKVEKNGFVVYSSRITCFDSEGNENYLASGKGVTKNLCLASGYAELIERLLSNYVVATNFVKVPFKKLKKRESNKVDVKYFLDSFKITNPQKENFIWVEALSILENEKVAIPYYFLKLISNTNGLAAGNTIEEAFYQAFCEVCERYSNIEHLIKKIPSNTVDKKTIKNKKILRFIEFFEDFNFEVEIKDMTLGGRVPVMGVLFINNNLKNETRVVKDIYYKTLVVGSHFNLEEAIIRCFLEEVQGVMCNMNMLEKPGRLFYGYKENEYDVDIFKEYYTDEDHLKILKILKRDFHSESFINQRSLENFDYMEKGNVISFSELKSVETKDFLEDVELIKEVIKKNKWQAFIVDHSIKECDLRVIRLFIPSVSDCLRSFFKEGSVFDDHEHLIKLRLSFNFDEKKIEMMDGYKKYHFLKYHFLPKVLLHWGNPTKLWSMEIVKQLLETIMLLGDQKEYRKIKKITDQIVDFETFLKNSSRKKNI